MRGSVIFGAGAAALLVGVAWWQTGGFSAGPAEVVVEPPRPPEAAPLCPWRDPELDLQMFFPEATRHSTEARIMSGRRLELARALGGEPAPDELVLRLHRAWQGEQVVGTLLTRRVKGRYGAIEIVLAVGGEGRVRGLRYQRWREPPAVTAALQDPGWLGAFAGKTMTNAWKLSEDIPAVEADARPSAQAVVAGVRDLLILLDQAGQAGVVLLESGPPLPGSLDGAEGVRRTGEGTLQPLPARKVDSGDLLPSSPRH